MGMLLFNYSFVIVHIFSGARVSFVEIEIYYFVSLLSFLFNVAISNHVLRLRIELENVNKKIVHYQFNTCIFGNNRYNITNSLCGNAYVAFIAFTK